MGLNLSQDLIPVIAIVTVFGFLTITSLAHHAYKCYCFGHLSRLKERLLEAGMTSAEIERVVNAGTRFEAELPLKQKQSA